MEDKETKIERVVEYHIEYPKFREMPLITRVAMVIMLSIAACMLLALIWLFAYVIPNSI